MVPSCDRMLNAEDRARLRAHGLAIAAVAVVWIVKRLFGITEPAAALLFSGMVVACSAAAAGFQVGSVAALTAVLAVRLAAPPSFLTTALFAAEGLFIALLASTLSRAVDEDGRLFEEKDGRIRELQADVRRLRAIDLAAARLEGAALDYAVVLLDYEGRITSWRDSAARLFRRDGPLEGLPGASLVDGEFSAAFEAALAKARTGSVERLDATVPRTDADPFDAEIEVRLLTANRFEGFVLLVRDRTREQEWHAFAVSSADAQVALREEADVAQRQLATLQHVTDPTLNALPASQAAAALLDRLRVAIDADGVALIRVGPFRRRIVSLSESLAEQGAADRRQNDARTPQDDRILLIQNDPARVSAMSQVNWPETVSSLIAVPVLSGGTVEGTIEVVGLRSRRSTEWEIALVQVVAARIAGRLQDESYLDAGAVA